MIRYIYIGDQILDGARDFAFYDTVGDNFVQHPAITPVFNSIEDFTDQMQGSQLFDRALRLIPENGDRAPYKTEDDFYRGMS